MKKLTTLFALVALTVTLGAAGCTKKKSEETKEVPAAAKPQGHAHEACVQPEAVVAPGGDAPDPVVRIVGWCQHRKPS